MTFEEHCAESKRLFGKSYEEVHRWLDEFMGAPGFGARHRRIRHHEAAIREVMKLFGIEAGKVARQHIISDLKGSPKNNFPFSHLSFRPSLIGPHSQNPLGFLPFLL